MMKQLPMYHFTVWLNGVGYYNHEKPFISRSVAESFAKRLIKSVNPRSYAEITEYKNLSNRQQQAGTDNHYTWTVTDL